MRIVHASVKNIAFAPVAPARTNGRMPESLNLAEKLSQVHAPWQPKIIGAVNDFHVKVVKLQGEFVWHHHEREDELFLVVKGRLLMKFRDADTWVNEGECIVVPRGVEHCPVAPEEVHVVLFEPATTLNTGNVRGERTVAAEWLHEEERG
jgi:mannose-6-phosphate isomerase-like protein (cupin superfamily)